jgi:hypothetical protein
MNIMPFVGFYWRQHQTIADLLGGGDGKTSALAIDFIKVNAPLVKARWPALNKNGLLDDFVNTLEESLIGPVV